MGLSLHLIPDHHSVRHCSHILHTLRGFSSSRCQTVLTHLASPQRLFFITVSSIAHTSCIPSEAFLHHSVKHCSHILHTLRGFLSSQCQTLLTSHAYPHRLYIIMVSNNAHTLCIPTEAFRHHSVKQCSHIVHTLRGFSSSQCQTVLTHHANPQRLFIIRVSNSAHMSCIPAKAFLQPSVSGRDVP